MNAVFDSNILIDFLRGIPQARRELGRYDHVAISVVSWIEVMVGAPPELEQQTESFLGEFVLVPLDETVARRAVSLQRKHRIKLPDAVVWASAEARGMLLVTRDKVFPGDEPGIRIPYRL